MDMSKNIEREILDKIRSLLALERNFLAEQRTVLAEFRTGLALSLIAPPASTVIPYIISILQIEPVILYDIINFTFFSILTVIGVWISYNSRNKLKKIESKLNTLKKRELELVQCCEAIDKLLGEFFV
jgi:uncharacterized membrane protein YidH (DUF202 family)